VLNLQEKNIFDSKNQYWREVLYGL
jgi:hypothetical protein